MSRVVQPDGLAAALRPRRGASSPQVIGAIGPESFLRERVLREVTEHFLGAPDSPDLITLQGATTSLDADRDTLGRFFDETRTGSLFGGRKVVALRHADGLVSRYRKEFLHWLANPGQAAVSILLADDVPPTVLKAIEGAGLLVRCGGRGTRGASPTAFAVERASLHGKRLGRAEADTLVDLIGGNLTALANAVEVLSLHAGEREIIGHADIDALFQSAREGSIWEFGDLLVEGDVERALTQANRCFAEGIPESRGKRVTRSETTIAVRLVSAYANAVCRVLDARAQLDEGVPRNDVTFSGRVPWGARQSAVRTASRRRPAALAALAVYAEETDRGLKSGGPAGRAAIARLVAAVSRVP